MPMLVRFLLAIVLLTAVALPAAAQYPAKSIRLIVPFPAGGPADNVARIISQPLGQVLGQPLIVENKPGADGAIAGMLVAKSAPDGHTLFLATSSAMSAVPSLRRNPPYDPVTDFTPITSVGRFTFFLFVHASVPANTLAELIDYARANPGKLNYGSSTTTGILAAAQLKSFGKMDMVHVPYKGDASAMPDLLNARVQLIFATPALYLPHVRDGSLRALTTLLISRSPLLPDVPTMAEAGMPRLAIVPWMALVGPATMPKDIVVRLSREVNAVLKLPDVRVKLDKQALEPSGSTPEGACLSVRRTLF